MVSLHKKILTKVASFAFLKSEKLLDGDHK